MDRPLLIDNGKVHYLLTKIRIRFKLHLLNT